MTLATNACIARSFGRVTTASPGRAYQYGMQQDNAAKTGVGSQDICQRAFPVGGTNFSYSFPLYSVTVLALSPSPAQLLPVPASSTANRFVFQLQGQTGVPYVIQTSSNLITWTPSAPIRSLPTH